MVGLLAFSILPSGPSGKGGNQEIKGTAWGGKKTSDYGWRDFNGGENHRGVDVASKQGTAIPANVSGKVIASGSAPKFGYHHSYGNVVIIVDSKGYKHIYAHMDKTSAKVGSTVSKGAFLGTVGSTGNSTGPHLHYEVNKNGKTINPMSWMP